ncbi:MAG TPA: hypothetical protein VJR70_07565 [Stellaceae bacterium]|nr:hypothetical protein [Stellaceae bacterium]
MMLGLAFWLVCAASAIGSGLAVAYLRRPQAKAPPLAILVAHAVLGAGGLVALLFALRRGVSAGIGTAGFAPLAAVLLAMTLALGLALAGIAWCGRRPAEALVGTHAGLAIGGLVLLLALVALG